MNMRNQPQWGDRDLPPVYAATYDHIGVILWGVEKLEHSVDRAVDWLQRHPEFRVGWDHEAFTYDYLANHHPELLDKMRDTLVRFRGRLGVGSCTYGQPLSMFINEESNIRQLTMAMDATEKHLKYPVSVYIMSEHAFHSQMPQLLAGCGFRGAILRTHFMMYGHNPEFDAPVGWWTGVDGSRIATLPTYPGQASTPPKFTHKIPGNTSTLDNRILTDAPSEAFPITLADFRRQFGGSIQPLVATRADDVRSLEELAIVHEGDPGYQWVLLEEIFDLLPQPRTEFRTQPNDFKVRMPWGYCGNWIWNRSRATEVKVLIAERMAAIHHALGGDGFEAQIEAAWKNLLVGQHHDIQICGLLDDAEHYLGEAIHQSQVVIDRVMQDIAPRVGDGHPDECYVVFNPLSWPRSELVETPDGATVVSVPGLGFKSIAPQHTQQSARESNFEWQADALCLRTPFYEVHGAERGGFRMVRDVATGQNLLVPPKDSGTLAGLIDGRWRESLGRITAVKIEGQRAVLVEEGEIGGIPYRSEWVFYTDTRRFDWRGELEFAGQTIGRPKHAEEPLGPLPQDARQQDHLKVPAFNDHEFKLRLRFFPYLSPCAVGIRDYPFGIAETDDRYVQGVYWTAVSDGNVGLALFNRGLMGSVREPDGALSSVLAFSLPYVWHTRILHGRHTYELGVLPFAGDWREANLHRQALEYNFPCVVTSVSESASSLGEAWSPYRDRGDGAIMSALYVKHGQVYMRFYEHEGASTEIAFDWMGEPAQLTEVDMRGRQRGALGTRTRLTPWQILTVAIHGQ